MKKETKSDLSSINKANISLASISKEEEKQNLNYLKNMQEERGGSQFGFLK